MSNLVREGNRSKKPVYSTSDHKKGAGFHWRKKKYLDGNFRLSCKLPSIAAVHNKQTMAFQEILILACM